jgi:hypothetical protein
MDDNDIDGEMDDELSLLGAIVLGEDEPGADVLDSPDETSAQISSEKQNISPGQAESLQVGAVSHVKSN